MAISDATRRGLEEASGSGLSVRPTIALQGTTDASGGVVGITLGPNGVILTATRNPDTTWTAATGGVDDDADHYIPVPTGMNSWRVRNESGNRIAVVSTTTSTPSKSAMYTDLQALLVVPSIGYTPGLVVPANKDSEWNLVAPGGTRITAIAVLATTGASTCEIEFTEDV